MSKKPRINAEDQALFRQVVGHVKPIKNSKVIYSPSPPTLKVRKKSISTEREEEIGFSDYDKLPLVDSEAILQFFRPGIHPKVLRNFRNGKYNAEAILDLHGLTVDNARQTLSRFLIKCQKNRVRHALIIHGKGHHEKPVLKNKLNHWLRQTEQVVAFYSATGGSLYVLLKIQRAEI